MGEPWECDPDNLIEIDFVHEAGVADHAAAAVDRAMREVARRYPSNPKMDEEYRERTRRVRDAFPDTSIITLAVAEFLTGARHDAPAASIKAALVEAEGLARQVADLQRRLGGLANDLQLSVRTAAGDAIADSAAMASGAASDAWRSLIVAAEALQTGKLNAPTNVLGRGGALGAMRISPDIALLAKLERLWRIAGLNTNTGRNGHGLDVFLYHALAADDPMRVTAKGWLGKLRAKMTKEMSTEKSRNN